MACSGTAQGCRIVWGDFVTGQLIWYEAGVSTASGAVTPTAAYLQNYLLFDTPSVAFNPPDSSFKLAITTMNDAIYSFTMGLTETSWTGTGDIWNNPQSFVSAGMVSVRDELSDWRTFTWFPRYF